MISAVTVEGRNQVRYHGCDHRKQPAHLALEDKKKKLPFLINSWDENLAVNLSAYGKQLPWLKAQQSEDAR